MTAGWWCLLVALASGMVQGLAQVPLQAGSAAVAPVEVRLEAHDGKTQFALGERIELDLVFRGTGPGLGKVNATQYGDLADKVTITPATGWFAWQGRSGHDYAVMSPWREGGEWRVALVLNQGFVFGQPGHYEVRVTTNRVQGSEMTTNAVGLDLVAMPAEVEVATVRELVGEMQGATTTTAGKAAREDAADRLAALGGDDALRAKLSLILAQDEAMRQVEREALASTRHLGLELQLLEEAWADPHQPVNGDLPEAMQEVRSLLRGEGLPGWVMAQAAPGPGDKKVQQVQRDHRADMEVLIRSLPQRAPEDRAEAAYLLMEDHSLTATQLALVKPVALEEFARMEPMEQHMLLETGVGAIHDPALVPALRAMLDRDPVDGDALQELIRFDPHGAKPYLQKALCTPGKVVRLNQVQAFPAATLPEADACFAATLATPPKPQGRYLWGATAVLAGRFATAAVLPALRSGWVSPDQNDDALPLLLRYAPAEALTRVQAIVAAQPDQHNAYRNMQLFQANNIFDALHAGFPEVFCQWLRALVQSGPDRAAGTAAYELSRYGSAADEALLEERLRRVRAQWADRVQEVAMAAPPSPAGEARQLEMELLSDLRGATLWQLSDEQLAVLGRECMSSWCADRAVPRVRPAGADGATQAGAGEPAPGP